MSKPTTNTSQKIPYISPDNGITRYYADRFYLDAPTGLLEYQLAQKEREAQQESSHNNNNNSTNSTTETNVEYCKGCGERKTPPNPNINNGRTLFNRSKLINSLDLAAVIIGTYSIGDFDYLSDEFPKLFPRRQKNRSATNCGVDGVANSKDVINKGVNQKVGSRKRKRRSINNNTRSQSKEKSDHVPTLVLHGQKRFNLNTWTKGRYSVSSWTHSLYSGPAGSDKHLPHHKNTEGEDNEEMLSMEETIKRMERDSQIKTQSQSPRVSLNPSRRQMMECESQDSIQTDDNDTIRMEQESQDSLPTDADILDDLRFPGCGRRLDDGDMDAEDGDDHSMAEDDEEEPQPHSQPQSNIEESEDSLQGIRGGGDSQQFVESQDSVMTYQTPPVIDDQSLLNHTAVEGKGEDGKPQQQQQQQQKHQKQQIDSSPADDSVVNKIWYETPPGCKAELELKDVDTQVKEKKKELNADVVIRPTFTYGNVTIKLPRTPKTHKRRRRRRRRSSSGSSKRGKEDKSEVKQQQQPLPKEDQPLEVATAAGSGPVKETPISSKGSNIKPADMNVDEDETKKPPASAQMDTDNAADTNITATEKKKKPAPSTDKDKDKADMEIIDLCDSSQSQGTIVNEMPKHASEVKQPPRKRQKTSFNHTVFATTSTNGKAKGQVKQSSKKKKKKTSFDRTVFSDITRWDSTAKPVHSFDGQVFFTQILPAWCKPILPKDLSPKKRARAAQSAWKGEADEFNKKEEDSTSKMGCNHPKFFLLFEKSGSLVVIITTSNLTPGTSTEGSWVQRFESITSTDAAATTKQGSGVDFGMPSDFGVILSDFLEKQSEAADLANDNYSAKAVCGKNSKGAYVKVTKTMGDGVSLDDTDDDGEDDNDWRQPNAKFPGSNADEVEAFFHGEKRTATFTHFAHYEHAKNWRKKYFSRKKYVGNVLPDGFLRRFVQGLEKKGLAGLADQYQFDTSQVHLVSTVPGDYLGNLGDRKPCVTYGPQRVASILSRINDDKNGNSAWIPPSLNDRLVIQPTSFGIRWTSTDLETVAQSFLHHPQQNEDTHQEPLEMTDIVWPSLELFDEIERQRRIIWNKPPMEGETLAQRWANKQTENGVSCY